jgi:multicomponent Na+:H+ antiporter subunit D
VAVVKAGVFAIFRVIFHILGPETLQTANLGSLITYIAAVTVLAASLVALTQDSMKRRLAYSTIGQLAYMVLGAGMLSATGRLGGVMHLAMHAFGKITLFFCAGAIYVASKKKYISQMDGLGRRMPITFLAFFLGSLSIIGMPPLGGFISKWNLVIGAVDGGQLTLQTGIKEAPLFCLVPLCLTAFGSLVLFFFHESLLRLAQMALGIAS